MAKQYKVQITNGTTKGPFTIYYVYGGERIIATIMGTSNLAENLTYTELVAGVSIELPTEATEIILVDTGCNEEYYLDISSHCGFYFVNYDGLLYYHSLVDNNTDNVAILQHDATNLAISDNSFWVLNSQRMIYQYNLFYYAINPPPAAQYGPIDDIVSITSIPGTDNLYGMGTNLYKLTPSIIFLSGMYKQFISSLNPGYIIVNDTNYNPRTNRFLIVGRNYGISGWPFVIVEYDMSGNVIATINWSSQVPYKTPVFIYTYGGENYVVTNYGEVYKINRTTLSLTFVKQIYGFTGAIASGKQKVACRDCYIYSTVL